jgi:hypothetical protein
MANIIIEKDTLYIVADKEDVEKLVNELKRLGLNIRIVYQAPCG